jgi:large subunit ribosomal protein L16
MIFEMEGVDRAVAKEAFRLAAHKIAIQTQFVERHHAA